MTASTSPKIMPVIVAGLLLAGAPAPAHGDCPDITDPVALNDNALSDSGDDDAPRLATDGVGNWVAVWQSEEDLGTIGSDLDILFSRSTDNGASWTPPAALNTTATVDGGSAVDKNPQIQTDALGNWVVVWVSTYNLGGTIGSDEDILISRSNDNGINWSPPAPLHSNAGSDSGADRAPALATDNAGNWVAVWESTENLGGTVGDDEDILVLRSTNNGATWTPPAPLNSHADEDTTVDVDGEPQIATDAAGHWVAVWKSKYNLGGNIGNDQDILVSRSTNNGATWTPVALLNSTADSPAADSQAEIATDSNGWWIVVWMSQDDFDGTIGTEPDIVFSRSQDNGASWSPAAVVNTTAAIDNAFDFDPHLHPDGFGNWVVVWNSKYNLGGEIGIDYDCLFAISLDDGQTWTPPAPLNANATEDSGDDVAVRIAADAAASRWVTVWVSIDDFDGTIGTDEDILTAYFQFTDNDCNGNGIPDECDPDCDEDGIPDACEIADCLPEDPACQDCQPNAVPDACDLDPGDPDGNLEVSQDCQGDLIPDECQTSGDVVATWVGGAGNWSLGTQWCPDLTPDWPNNTAGTSFDVIIEAPGSVVTLDQSPTISTLWLAAGAAVEVNDGSGANVRSLSVDGTISNDGVFRATDRERLVLDTPLIDQGLLCEAGGLLEATDGALGPDEENDKSALVISGALVVGGSTRSDQANAEIQLIGGAVLEEVCVEGIVVPDGQSGAFSGTIVNNGVITVAPQGASTALLGPTEAGGTLVGGGRGDDAVRLGSQATAWLGSFKSTFTNADNHSIAGAGLLFGGVTNLGTIQADVELAAIIFFPPGDKENHGQMLATNGGTLRLEDDVVGTGSVTADHGNIAVSYYSLTAGAVTIGIGGQFAKKPDADDATAVLNAETVTLLRAPAFPESGGKMFLQENMAVNTSGDFILAGGRLGFRGDDTPPILNVDGTAVIDVAGDFGIIGGSGAIAHNSASPLTLGGNFLNESTVEWADRFDWLGGGLVMHGPDQTIEAAGEDRGPVPEGLIENFALGVLELASGTTVTVIDIFENQHDGSAECDEALYVDVLIVNTGAVLNTNGCRVYYNELISYGSIPGLDIDVLQICPGDMNGDDTVDATDLAWLLGAWGPCAAECPPSCPGDFNHDCLANGADLAQLLGNWSGRR